MPTALSEIIVGTVAQLVIGALFVDAELGGKTSWISFLAGTGWSLLAYANSYRAQVERSLGNQELGTRQEDVICRDLELLDNTLGVKTLAS